VTRPNIDITLGGGWSFVERRFDRVPLPDFSGFQYVEGTPFIRNDITEAYHRWEQCGGVTRVKPKGWMNPTPYDLHSKTIVRSRGSVTYGNEIIPESHRYGLISGQIHGNYTGFNDEYCYARALLHINPPEPEEMTNGAFISALGNLKASKVNLGIAYAERNRTMRMVGDTATKLVSALRALKRGQPKKAARILGVTPKRGETKVYKGQTRGKIVPEQWLALQYGWKPLLKDIYGAVSELKRRKPLDFRVTAIGKRNWKGPFGLSNEEETGIPFAVSGTLSCKAKVRIDAIPDEEFFVTLNRVGILNPLLVAWELVPFSFIVDWAWPIGDYLESLDSWIGWSNDSWTTKSWLTRAEMVVTGRSKSSPGSWISGNFTGTKNEVKLHRTVSQGRGLPHLPSLKNPASLTHMANGLSLLATAFASADDRWLKFR
jgi:hypothetical protein